MKRGDYQKKVQQKCALPLRLNHYAVKSREDYLHKFQRGRISRGTSARYLRFSFESIPVIQPSMSQETRT